MKTNVQDLIKHYREKKTYLLKSFLPALDAKKNNNKKN